MYNQQEELDKDTEAVAIIGMILFILAISAATVIGIMIGWG